MYQIYNVNGLPFWNQQEIRTRQYLVDMFALSIQTTLLQTNKAWCFHQIESPVLIPRDLINQEYSDDQIFVTSDNLVLRPETTPASYAYAKHVVQSQVALPPLVVWQVAKSFRQEQDQVTKNMRLKEFYQQEFQCIFTEDTKNDYFDAVAPLIEQMVNLYVGMETRLIPSDRLPKYSLKTMDVEVFNGEKWMEVVSISLRKDVPFEARFKENQKPLLNLEIAIGIDRCVYNALRLYK